MAKWKEHLGSAAAQPMKDWLGGRCEHCYAKEGQYHHPFCDTQLKRQQDQRRIAQADHVLVDKTVATRCSGCDEEICDCDDDIEEDDPDNWTSVIVKDGYDALFAVLRDALDQAQNGKGHERHADSDGQAFTEQPVLTISRAVGLGFPLGQAMKKIQECQRMDRDAAKRELLGAINYLAAAILFLDE